MALAGALGGVVTFVLLNPMMVAEEDSRGPSYAQDHLLETVRNVVVLGAVLGMAIGAALIAADEAQTRSARRLAVYSASGLVVGAVCGIIGSVAGQLVYSVLLGGATMAGRPSMITLVVARSFGWAMMGAAAGLCPGMVSRSLRRVWQGILGGVVGGGLGGLLFDSLASVTQGGSLPRAVGFLMIGGLVGALVSLVEEFGKEYWITALTGTREGRSFILAKDVTLLGRNETADVPLFGDASVQRQHARLLKQNGVVVLTADPGQVVTVNNRPVASSLLNPGDLIGIGSHRFRFSARRAAANTGQPVAPTEAMRASGYTPPPVTASANVSAAPPMIGAAITQLTVIAGPHAGTAYPITPGAILGRDARCDVPLTADMQCSRQHARLIPVPMGWRIQDGGSTNGTLVNGKRVADHMLMPGDDISIGQSVLRVS